jgi:hypothetical protein
MPRGHANPRSVSRLAVPGALMLCAIGAGAWACALADIPAAVWGRNPGAWLVGGLAAILVQRGGHGMIVLFPLLALVLLGSTFLGPEQSGVHRWLGLGPLSVNAAMLMLPAAVVALASLGGTARWPWLVALACMALLVAQPDRSQAIAFGAAGVWIALRGVRGRTFQAAIIVATVLLVAAALLRPDPLEPVPEVEGIFQLALAVSPPLAAIGLVSLMAFSMSPAWMMRAASPENLRAGEALSLYFLVAAVMPFMGAYPVPLVGVGVSPVLGGWLAIGALLAAGSPPRQAGGAPSPRPEV